MNIVDVPKEFQPLPYAIRYPVHHIGPHLEDYAYEFFVRLEEIRMVYTDRWYLPVFWDSYYISHGFGKNIKPLEDYIASLPTDRKYFTILQYSAPVVLPENCLVFGSGGIGDIPLPLLTSPHPIENVGKIYKASFMGKIATHPCRLEMLAMFANLDEQIRNNYYLSDSIGTEAFRQVMNESIYALCPRGYGKTSFRLYEAMQMGAIPIYIYDEPWLPYTDKIDWIDLGLMVHISDIETIPDLINDETNADREAALYVIKELWNDYFTLEGICEQIVRMLENEK